MNKHDLKIIAHGFIETFLKRHANMRFGDNRAIDVTAE